MHAVMQHTPKIFTSLRSTELLIHNWQKYKVRLNT